MKKVHVLLAGLLMLIAAGRNTPLISYPTTSASEAKPPSECARYYHDVCKNWRLGQWLPTLIDGFEPFRRHAASTVHFTDGFIYEGKVPKGKGWAESQGYPADGTPFVYGNAGPPKGTVVYDYVSEVAFYSQGCCAWRSTVLAARVHAPPVHVVNRSLRDVHTVHGIALGDSPRQVEAVYGNAVGQSIPGQPGMTLLSYQHLFSESCGQFQNFAFLGDRLVYIELLDGC